MLDFSGGEEENYLQGRFISGNSRLDQVRRERRCGWNFFRWSRLSSLLLIRKIYEVWTLNSEENSGVLWLHLCLPGISLPVSHTSQKPHHITPHNTTQWHHAGVKHIFSASSQMFCFVSRLKWWLQQALHYNSKLYHRPQISVLVHSAGCFKLIKTKLPWKPTQWGFITSTLLYNWPATFAHLWYW